MAYITGIMVVIVVIITIVNDKVIEKKGGDTYYLWEIKAEKP